MNKNLTREESLKLDTDTYNKAMELQWPEHKSKFNLSGELNDCNHCGRKYVISCICNEAVEDWNKMLEEVREVSGKSTEDEL